MDKVLVAVFDNEAKARSASTALKKLAEADIIRVNASAIVTKGPGGAITVSRTERPRPLSTLGGTAAGILIGLPAGGVGAAVGATTGLIVGGMADMSYLKIWRDFLANVERTLEPGKTALVTQIYEEDTAAVDERLSELGGVVFRRPVGEVADEDYENDVARIRRRFRRE